MLPGLRPAICGEDRLPRRKKGKRPTRGAPGWAGISPSASQWEGVPRQPLQRGRVRSRASSPCLDLGWPSSCSPSVDSGMVGVA